MPEMIRIAAANHPDDEYVVSRVEALPFDDNTVDVILCLGVLEYLADVPVALREMRRVLRPGGHLIVSFPNHNSLLIKLSTIVGSAEHVVGAAIRRLRGQPVREEEEAHRHALWTAGQVARDLSGSSFQPLRFMFNTYGILWGEHVGRNRLNLALSKEFTHRFRNTYSIGNLMACTILVLAQNRESLGEDGET